MYRGLQLFSRIISVITVLAFCGPMNAISGDVAASNEIVEFSADMIRQIPNQDPILGKLYVAKDKIRIEVVVGKERRITIENASIRKTLHLNPARKEYMEIPWPAAKSDQPAFNTRRPLPGDPGHPCAKFAELKCKILNKEENIGNRKTEKWEIARVIPASEQNPQSQTMRSLIWADRRLGVNIREERFFNSESKGTSELRAIIEGSQPENLFQIPTDYQHLSIPKPSSAPPGTGGNMPLMR